VRSFTHSSKADIDQAVPDDRALAKNSMALTLKGASTHPANGTMKRRRGHSRRAQQPAMPVVGFLSGASPVE
jgi:hypothetical protein